MATKKPHGNANPIRDEAHKIIAAHLSAHGPNNWKVVLDALTPRANQATIWRWIKEVRDADPERPQLIRAKARIEKATAGLKDERSIEQQEQGVAKIARNLPVAPSPAYIAKNGSHGMANLDFVVEIHALYNDAKMLREYASKPKLDADGKPTGEVDIKNPMMWDKQIARRAGLLETAIKAVSEVWELRTMQTFYETIIEEIGKADKETQKRILVRLADLNSRAGYTMAMRL